VQNKALATFQLFMGLTFRPVHGAILPRLLFWSLFVRVQGLFHIQAG
jgi:hypothetical protein